MHLQGRTVSFEVCICVFFVFCFLRVATSKYFIHRYRNNVDLNAYNRQWKSLVICYGLYLKAIIIVWLGPFSTMWAPTIVITPISRAT